MQAAACGGVSISAAKQLLLPPQRVRFLRRPITAATVADRSSMAATVVGANPKWAQKTITLPPQCRGCHLITPK
ncbi:hypothetical protein Droror1_Dr00018290, partial [Drosera rotundifolia]